MYQKKYSLFPAVIGFFSLLIFSVACNPEPTKTTHSNTVQDVEQPSATAPAAPPPGFTHATANVNGVDIHYVKGGQGAPLVLLHGFGQNWYMWNRLLPELSKNFTVIAPDLRGVGESGKPDSGYDKKTMAVDIHELVKKLGYKSINLVGHDIGLMVAYAYAAQFEPEVTKMALLDALLPGVEPIWTQIYTTVWHFGFFARPVAGEVVAGKEKLFFTDFWTTVTPSKEPFSKDEAAEFIRAYSVKGATTGSFHWFGEFPRDAKDNLEFMKHKLNIPLLAMGGEYFSAPFLADHCRLVANNVSEFKIMGSGHWVVQEQTALVQQGLLHFFLEKK